jgi:type IV pilus assembly protein PilO
MKFGIRELLFVILLLAIPIGAYFWIFKPANQHIEHQKSEIQAKSQKLTNLRKAMAGIDDLNAEVQKLEEAVTFFESKLPPRHEIHKVLARVTEIAESHKLETKLFQTKKTLPCADYSEQPIQMDVYGDFDAYYQFMLDVEKMPRITRVKTMKIEKDGKTEGMTEASFTLSIYFDNDVSSS